VVIIENQGYFIEGPANRVKMNIGGKTTVMTPVNMEFQGRDDNSISDLAIQFVPDLVAESMAEIAPDAGAGFSQAYFIGRGFERQADNIFEGYGTLNTDLGKMPASLSIQFLSADRYNAELVVDTER
jgi:hypothetical protein